jgi:hypothetical protein
MGLTHVDVFGVQPMIAPGRTGWPIGGLMVSTLVTRIVCVLQTLWRSHDHFFVKTFIEVNNVW